MAFGKCEFLTASDIEQIHNTAMKYLANVGVRFPDEEVLETFAKHGAKVDGELVFLEEKQVMDALKSAPQQFTIHARNADNDLLIGDGQSVFAPGYGAPFLVDYEEGKRAPTMDDYNNLVKLAHALPNQDSSGHLLVEPSGVPAETAHIRMLHAHMLHSDKVFVGSAEGTLGAQRTVEMASILFGKDVHDYPITISLINSLTPLGFSDEMLAALKVFVQWGQPVVIAALAMAGSTSPVTLAGTLALQTAELLAGVVYTQWAKPGTPVVFGSTSTNIDMKSGALAIGGPELSQMVSAHAQLARHYGIPSRSGGSLTDASLPDAQAGFESMMGLLTTISSEVDFVLHAAGILSSYLAFSYEKFVLDDEMCGMVRRLRRGFEVSEDTLAYDVGAKVGPGGNYLMEKHTVKRCRKEFWKPQLCDRSGLEAWMSGGRKDALYHAQARWQKLVSEHVDPPLDAKVAQQLAEYVEEHAK